MRLGYLRLSTGMRIVNVRGIVWQCYLLNIVAVKVRSSGVWRLLDMSGYGGTVEDDRADLQTS